MKTLKYILLGLLFIMYIPFCHSQYPVGNRLVITLQTVPVHASDKLLSASKEILLRRLAFMNLQDVRIILDETKSELVVSAGDSIPREMLVDLVSVPGHFNIYETMNRQEVLNCFSKNQAGCLRDAVTKLHAADSICTGSSFILGIAEGKDTNSINKCFNSPDTKELLPKNCRLLWSVNPAEDGLYNLNCTSSRAGTFDEHDILEAHTDFADPGHPALCLIFREKVWKSWSDATARNINKSMVFVVDGKVIAAPRISEEIPYGKIALTGGGFTGAEVRKLAAVISAGAMPLNFTVVSKN